MFGAELRLDPVPERVLVAGVSGAGKTTLAQRIGAQLGLPHFEIDAMFHGPNWTRRPEFESDVDAVTQQPKWVSEWQYESVRELLADRADTLVWLDYPTALVMWRVITRTVRRRLRHQHLWNGNYEGPLWRFFTDEEHIVKWAWNNRHNYRERVPQLELSHPQLRIVRLRSHNEANAWLAVQGGR